VAPLVFLATLAALVAGLVRNELGPFPMALVALGLALALGTLPLLGELAPLLRADPAAEWIGALPVRPRELRAARTLALALVAGAMAVAVTLPAAVLITGVSFGERVLLPALAVVQAFGVAAALLWVQRLLGERGEALLTLLQAALLVLVLIGLIAGLRQLPALARLDGPTRGLLGLPSAWFAAAFAPASDTRNVALGLAGVTALFALGTLLAAPFPPAPRARSTRSALGTLLAPARRLALRFWVRSDERGTFEFVYGALPAERDFNLRTWPLVAMPLGFLFLGSDTTTVEGRGLWVLLLFAPVAYLPFILVHVPVTATPEARWLVATSPLAPTAEISAVRKVLAVRILLPLHIGLGVLTAALVAPRLALTLTPVAAACGWLALRLLYRAPESPPLSTPPAQLASAYSEGIAGSVLSVGIAASLVGLVAWQLLPGPAAGFTILAVVAGLELASARRSAS